MVNLKMYYFGLRTALLQIEKCAEKNIYATVFNLEAFKVSHLLKKIQKEFKNYGLEVSFASEDKADIFRKKNKPQEEN